MLTQALEGQEAANFLLSHLVGRARREIRYADQETREDPENIFTKLQTVFGEKLSSTQLLRMFCAREEKAGEQLQDFAYAGMELLDRALAQKPRCVPDRDMALRDNFAEKVSDPDLRCAL